MRKINIDLTGYPKIIDPGTLNKVANRKHPMAKLPSYPTNNEPTQYQEEVIVERRFKELCDSYSATFGVDARNINPMQLIMSFGGLFSQAKKLEEGHERELEQLAERIIREQYHLGEDEVLFDIELLNLGECKLPKEMNRKKKITADFEQTTDIDALKKRTINALSQGAALKSHYLFHLYRDEMARLSEDLPDFYQKLLITNDLFYYVLNDKMFEDMIESDDSPNNAGYVKLNFDGDIPVIEAKAICFPILLHELTKGCISLFSIPGIQNMTQELVDETDYVMAEIYEIRLGPTIWQDLHSMIEPEDYDIKKHILIELFKLESEDFHVFMKNVTANPEKAQKEIKSIVRVIRHKITEYELEKQYNVDEDDDLPYVDFSSLGL